MNDIQQAATRFSNWMKKEALPLWSSLAIDPEYRGSFERLDAKGVPDEQANKRIRVQFRQIIVFAIAQQRGWINNGAELISGLHHFAESFGKSSNSDVFYHHSLTNNNEIANANYDLYDCAFLLLSLAHRYHTFHDLLALQNAHRLLDALEAQFSMSNGGFKEGNYAFDIRRQNPHMHLFEAFLALYEASNDPRWLAKAGEIFTLFKTHFLDQDKHVIIEYFDHQWQPHADDNGIVVEPGHCMEWVWLLRKYEHLTKTPVSAMCDKLYDFAITKGQEASTHLLFDEVSTTGQPVKASKRLWPLTELIKAGVAQAKNGQKSGEMHAAQGISALFEFYLNRGLDGSYIDQLSPDNQCINDFSPASTLYHLMLACTEVCDYCGID